MGRMPTVAESYRNQLRPRCSGPATPFQDRGDGWKEAFGCPAFDETRIAAIEAEDDQW